MHKFGYSICFTLFFSSMAAMATAGGNTDSAEMYRKTCSVCHGEQGDGKSHAMSGLNPPPKNFTVAGLKARLSRDRMIQIVKNGKPGTAMTGFGKQLSQTQIIELVDYIRYQFMHDRAGKSIIDKPGEDGKSIYSLTCSVCHGENGAGASWGKTSFYPPPVNFAVNDKIRDLPRERMIRSVTQGRPGTAMTAFASQLDQQEIEAVVDYIRDTFMIDSSKTQTVNKNVKTTPHTQPSHAVSTVGLAMLQNTSRESDTRQQPTNAGSFNQPVSAGLQGNEQSGKLYYLQNCIACHGISGKGDGPRAYFIYPRPRNFLHPASKARFNRPVLFNAIKQGVKGREMPAWGKVLNDQQIADITEYVFLTYIRPVVKENEQ